ncbi:MAG: cytochrome c biogenesis protein CcdA [Candidatus Margulisiibacteriota bacterium]
MIFIAFFAGLLSFFSPCILPVIPSYIVYIAGVSLKDFEGENKAEIRKKTLINSLFFILGFSTIFILSGILAGALGHALFQFKDYLRIVGGVLIILFGLYLLGIVKIPLLDIEKRINLKSKPLGCLGSFLVGLTFASAWVPCVGPILGSILVLASSSQSVGWGGVLLISYSLGLAVPFLLTALAFNSALIFFKKIQQHMSLIMKISGIFIVIVGLLLLFNGFQIITSFLPL